jgi:phosphohistidine phosphatase SixA
MIVFALRHADRDPSGADALSPAGVKRAQFLARMLRESGVGEAYCSDAQRTLETLAPLKEALPSLSISEIPAGSPGGPIAHVAQVVADIKAQPEGTVAIVVSHSNTVGPIISGLGGEAVDPIAENEFDKLFVLFGPPAGKKTVLRLRY